MERTLIKLNKPVELKDFNIKTLPENAMVEIFSRLPVKDLYSSRLVSAAWYSDDLFNNPNFIRTFAEQNHSSILILHGFRDLFMVEFRKFHQYYNFPFEKGVLRLNNQYQLLGGGNAIYDNPQLLGSFGGYLFFSSSDEGGYLMCNPMRGESLVVPYNPANPRRVAAVGFCASKGYTLFDFARTEELPPGSHDSVVFAFNIGVDTKWRSLFTAPRPTPSLMINTSYRDRLYWVSTAGGVAQILCIDLVDERLHSVQGPGAADHGDLHLSVRYLAVVADNLCAFDFFEGHDRLTMWVMVDRGGQWEHKLSIRDLSSFKRQINAGINYHFIPITILTNGEVIFGVNRGNVVEHLIGHDPRTDRTRLIRLRVSGHVVNVFSPTFQPLREVVGAEVPIRYRWL